jgi:hypothetical protein
VQLNGLPLLSYWLTVIKQCPRLLPIEQNVFLLCNDGNEGEHLAECKHSYIAIYASKKNSNCATFDTLYVTGEKEHPQNLYEQCEA